MHQAPGSIPTLRGLLRAPFESESAFIAELAYREEVAQFIGRLTSEKRSDSFLLLLEITGRPAGVFGLTRSGALEGEDFELFSALDESREGQGLASEACAALIRWPLAEGAYPRVLACVNDSNDSSRRLVERLGMKRSAKRGLFREDVYAAEL